MQFPSCKVLTHRCLVSKIAGLLIPPAILLYYPTLKICSNSNLITKYSAYMDKIFILYNGSLMTIEQYKEMISEKQ